MLLINPTKYIRLCILCIRICVSVYIQQILNVRYIHIHFQLETVEYIRSKRQINFFRLGRMYLLEQHGYGDIYTIVYMDN